LLGLLCPRRSSLQCFLLAKNVHSLETELCDTIKLPNFRRGST